MRVSAEWALHKLQLNPVFFVDHTTVHCNELVGIEIDLFTGILRGLRDFLHHVVQCNSVAIGQAIPDRLPNASSQDFRISFSHTL